MGMLHRNKCHNWARNKACQAGLHNLEILSVWRETVADDTGAAVVKCFRPAPWTRRALSFARFGARVVAAALLLEGVPDLPRVRTVRSGATLRLAPDPAHRFVGRVGVRPPAWNGGVALPSFGLLSVAHVSLLS